MTTITSGYNYTVTEDIIIRNSTICSTAVLANMTFTDTSYCAHSISGKKLHRAEGIPIRRSESKLPAAHAVIFTVVFTAIQNKLSALLHLAFQKEYLVHPLS